MGAVLMSQAITESQRASKTKAEAAGGTGNQVMFHARDDSRGKSTEQSAIQPIDSPQSSEERKGKHNRKSCKFHRGDAENTKVQIRMFLPAQSLLKELPPQIFADKR
jgi:hypothetical protein